MEVATCSAALAADWICDQRRLAEPRAASRPDQVVMHFCLLELKAAFADGGWAACGLDAGGQGAPGGGARNTD